MKRRRRITARRRAALWFVDAAVGADGSGAWGLAHGEEAVASGALPVVRLGPGFDSTRAEAEAVLSALPRMPKGAELRTDSLSLVREIRRGHVQGVSGAVGEVLGQLAAHECRLNWIGRNDAGMRTAHQLARQKLRALQTA